MTQTEWCYRHLGHVVRKRRRFLGLTQQHLATAMGWTRASIANIEGGKQRVMLHDLPALARALKIHVSELLLGAWRK